MGTCQACRRAAPTKYVEFYQNIGMLVARSMRSIKGNLCRRCIRKYFWRLTGLTLITGWWGTISFFLNPFLVLNNVGRYVFSLGLADGGEGGFPVQTAAGAPAASPVAHPLNSFAQDIRIRLRGGETPAQIAAYLAPRTGVREAEARAYVESIGRQ